MPSGGTSPLDITSTPARRGIDPPWAATALGRAAEGTAKATMSWRDSSRSAARMTRIDSGRSMSGRYSSLRPLSAMSLAWSAVRQPRSTSRPARASMVATAVPHEPAPMTAARRSGGRPPSHSHWSITQGQMRSVTAVASVRDGAWTCGKVSARPTRTRTLCGRTRQPLRIASVPMMATGTTGAPVSSASRPTPRRGRPSAPGRMRVPSTKIRTTSPRARIALAVSIMSASPAPRRTGNAPRLFSNQAVKRLVNSSSLAT